MAVSNLNQVHANRFLASLSIALENENDSFLIPRICARRRVSRNQDSFPRFGRELADKSAAGSNARVLASVNTPGAPAVVAAYSVDEGTYNCKRHALKSLVTNEELQKSDEPLSPIEDTARFLRARIMNDLEFLGARIMCDADNYPAGNKETLTTGANGTSWNKASAAGTGSDPFGDLRDAKVTLEKIIQRPANVLALSARTEYHLGDHNDLSGFLQYVDETYVERDTGVPSTLRGLRIATGKAVADSAAEGAAHTGDYLFVDHTAGAGAQDVAIVCHVPASRTVGIRGYASFIWFDCKDATTGQHGVSLRTWYDDDRRGWWVEAAVNADVQAGIVDSNSKITGAFLIAEATV